MTDERRRRRVLLAEDDGSMRELLGRILGEMGLEVEAVPDGLAAMARLAEAFDLVITDIRMPGADGIQVLEYARRKWPATPVIVLTAFGTIPGAVDAMRLGAFDYLQKPLPEPQALREVVARALAQAGRDPRPVATVVAEDPLMAKVEETARRVAPTETTVLLLGESGTGKEVIARLIHEASPRAGAAFVAVNCAALAETLLESELFGHEKGAFTGAHARHQGRFEQAHQGTLLLDEVGEMSPALQAKLLRVLQERTFERVGGEQTVTVDVRVVAATNRDLGQQVARGAFREDLYYRLAVFPIEIPPLRERRADIIPLARHFLELLAQGGGVGSAPELTEGARSALLEHTWPGNVRELQNVLERSVILSGGGAITPGHLGLHTSQAASAAPTQADGKGTLKQMERRAIQAALEAENGNRRRAAKRLGIALRTLQYKIKEYGLTSDNPPD